MAMFLDNLHRHSGRSTVALPGFQPVPDAGGQSPCGDADRDADAGIASRVTKGGTKHDTEQNPPDQLAGHDHSSAVWRRDTWSLTEQRPTNLGFFAARSTRRMIDEGSITRFSLWSVH